MSKTAAYSAGNPVQNDATRGTWNENDTDHGRRGLWMNEERTGSRFIWRPVSRADHTVFDNQGSVPHVVEN